MNNTVCIYVIYDVQSVINPYIGEVLREILRFVKDIYVICNFPQLKKGLEYVAPYTEKVCFRENVGYDSGAYKDAIVDFIGIDALNQYDELLLTNDTYFAPIYPFDDMFSTMEDTECDFWGVTRHQGGFDADVGEFGSHIQSYFLCFKKKVFHSEAFRIFWEKYEYPNNKGEAIDRFELGINRCLLEHGFIGKAYTDVSDPPFLAEYGFNPYTRYALKMIRDHRIPMIKKTVFFGKNPYLISALRALEYIRDSTAYDSNLIKNYINEYQNKGLIGPYFDFREMDQFVIRHKRIYIYGAGVWGHIVADYLSNRDLTFESYLVTNPNNENEVAFADIKVERTDGIIIAQEYKEICDNIRDYIGCKVDDDQIFTPCYPEMYKFERGVGN